MSKKILLALCLLSLNNIALASQDDDSREGISSSASDIQPEELGSTMVHPGGKLIGNVTVPYRYQTEADVKQTLGYLKAKTKSKSTANDISSASDISPQEDLVAPELIQPSAPAKVKKAVKKVKKPAVKSVVKSAPSVSNIVQTTTEPSVPQQDSTVTVKEAVTPATPVEKVDHKNTPEIKNEINKAVPAQSSTVVSPSQETIQSGIVTVPPQESMQSGVIIAPQEPIQDSSQTNAIPESNTILEFNQNDVELSETHKVALLELANKVKGQSNFILKLQSYGSVTSSDIAEARRLSLQRAIKARKFLIENEMNPNNISVNAVEDVINKSNKIEIKIERNN